MDDELEQWLQEQPLDELVEIDDETVYLAVRPGGAELGAYLLPSYTQGQLQEAMKSGFQSVMEFDAGLGRTADGNTLVLNQWLPDATGWLDAAEPLEKLLNQLEMWRKKLAPVKASHSAGDSGKRSEDRLRMLFAGSR